VRNLIGVLVLVLLIVSVVAAAFVEGGGRKKASPGSSKVGVVYITGIISDGEINGGILSPSTIGVKDVLAALREAEEDPAIKALVLRCNSPGGTAAASQEVAKAVERVRKAGKKVVTSMGDVAASGAYWIAAGSDRIYANPATITGSIGVMIEFLDMTGLYGKIGVAKETIKSGPYKDMGSESRPITAEERRIFQKMVDDIYNQFVDRVAEGRHMSREEVLRLADGQIFTGRQAKDLGLVDELGDFQDAVQCAGRLAGIEGEPVVKELGPRNFWDTLFRNVGRQRMFPSERITGWLLCPLFTQR